jgi:hypothetical protein
MIEAQLPTEFKGSQFGPMLRSFILYQYYKTRVPYEKIGRNLHDWVTDISAGPINNILNELSEDFAKNLSSARKLKKPEITNSLFKMKGDRLFTRDEIEELLRPAPF